MSKNEIQVKKRNGRLQKLDINKINLCAERACEDIIGVSPSEVVLDAHVQLYDKITTKEIDKALIMSASQKIEKESNLIFTERFLERAATVTFSSISINFLL